MQNGSLPNWNNTQTGGAGATNVEKYGTSWVRDLMRAKSYSWDEFFLASPASGSRFNGAVDANHGFSTNPTIGHASHGLGMNFDLGIGISFLTGIFLTSQAPIGPTINPNVPGAPGLGGWSNQYAVDLSEQLLNESTDAANQNLQRDAMRDFLALYSVMRNNGAEANGWDDLPISGTGRTPGQIAQVRAALFGDGTRDGALIRRALIGGVSTVTTAHDTNGQGQAELLRMRQVLNALGIVNQNFRAHHNHFHIDLKPPGLVEISGGGSNLLAASKSSTTTSPERASTTATPSQTKYDAAMSICSFVAPTGHPDFPIANQLYPAAAAESYFHTRGTSLLDPSGLLLEPLQTTLIDGPRHGEVVLTADDPRLRVYRPNAGYLGPDQMTFEVEVKGKKLKVIYSVVVNQLPSDQVYKDPELNKLCPDGFGIKELPNSGKGGKGSSLDILELPADGPITPEKLAEFHAASIHRFRKGSGRLGYKHASGGRRIR